MYRYDRYDHALTQARVAQFRDQVARWKAGELSDDEFRPLRLQNGLYIQRHAPMLRVAVPYGLLSSTQARKLADVSRRYDRGYGHFTTRQNLQFNWPQIERVPDLLGELAEVEMHAIQTSGSCIRSITSDAFAGIAPDEVVDPRPYCEILRQWSTFHPEFTWLPRKFKLAVSGSPADRAVTRVHDIGLNLVRNEAGEVGFRVLVGGGLGRTPILAEVAKPFLPWQHVLTYCEAILRVYNRYARRDNLYKSRIKILVKTLGIGEFARQVEAEWEHSKDGPGTITQAELDRVSAHFAPPPYETGLPPATFVEQQKAADKAFAAWLKRNVHAHKVPGYAAVTLSLKAAGRAPGDVTAEDLETVADLADRYSFGELRSTHEQNLVLPDVRESDLHALWVDAKAAGFATPNIGLLTDLICCPGGDYCSLANARSIPIANAIRERFDEIDYLHDLGEIDLKMSGCPNACGHHHVGHIGILGVDKANQEWYQITVGGNQGPQAAIGTVIGRAFPATEVVGTLETLLELYLERREGDERFIDTFGRIGIEPFRVAVYGDGTNQTKERQVANG